LKYTLRFVYRLGNGHLGVFLNVRLTASCISASKIAEKANDTFCNFRQYAVSALARKSVQANKNRFKDICKEAEERAPVNEIVTVHYFFHSRIFDCIDTVTSKVLLAKIAQEKNIKIISSMGTGNKLDPTKFEVADISKTSYCPLAKSMRKLLRDAGIKKLTVVYSREEPKSSGGRTPGSISFVPPVAGMIMTSKAICELID